MTMLAQIGWTVGDWIGVLGLAAVFLGPIIGLLFRQTAEQAGTNVRLDAMNKSLDQIASENTRIWDHVGRHESRLNDHEVKLSQHEQALRQR